MKSRYYFLLFYLFLTLPFINSTHSKSPDPDFILAEDFESTGLSEHWAQTGKWQVIPDPENPANKVLFIDATNHSTLLSKRRDFKNYALEFRMRFETDYRPYPNNDNVHWPSWGIILKDSPDNRLNWGDQFIWSQQFFTWKKTNFGRDHRKVTRSRWHQFRVTSYRNDYRVYMDGKPISEVEIVDVPNGALGFSAMHERFWIDDIQVTQHPDALLYERFATDLSETRWKPQSHWEIAIKDGNRFLTSKQSGSQLRSQKMFRDYVMHFKIHLDLEREAPTKWRTILKGAKAQTDLSLLVDLGPKTLSIGSEKDGQWTSLSPSSKKDLPKDLLRSGWNQFKVIAHAGNYQVYLNQTQVLETSTSSNQEGIIGFESLSKTVALDDVLIKELPIPIYRIQDLEQGQIYTISEEKGLLIDLTNEDIDTHKIAIHTQLKDRKSGDTTKTDHQIDLKPGASVSGEKILIKADQPGNYEISAELSTDGRPFASYQKQLTVLTELPKESPAYKSKLGITAQDMLNPKKISILNKLGLQWARTSPHMESQKNKDGTWNFTRAEQAAQTLQSDRKIDAINLHMESGMGHTLNGIRKTKDKFSSTARHFAGQNLYFQIWNEPNHAGFWRLSPRDPADYAALLKEVYNAIKAEDPTAVGLGPSTSGPANDYLRGVLENGGGNYIDQVSYQPYGYPKMPELIFEAYTKRMKAEVDNFGGWLDHMITEFGYVTANTGQGISDDKQAQALLRSLLIANGLDFMRAVCIYRMEDYINPNDNEHRFGIIHPDQSAKPAYIGLATMNRVLANTEYLGFIPVSDTKDAYLQVYRRFDKTPVLVGWSMTEHPATLAVGTKELKTTSIYGEVSKLAVPNGMLSLKLSGEPLYLESPSIQSQVLLEAIGYHRGEKYDFLIERLEKIKNSQTKQDLLGLLKTADAAIQQTLKDKNALKQASSLRNALDGFFGLAGKIINLHQEGKLTLEECGILTEGIWRYANAVRPALTLMEEALPSKTASSSKLKDIQSALKKKKGAKGALIFADRMLHQALINQTLATSIQAENKAMSLTYSYLAEKLVAIASQMSQAEEVFYRETLFNVLPKNLALFSGSESKLTTTFFNGQEKAFPGKVTLSYPEEWNQPDVSIEKEIQPNKNWKSEIKFKVPDNAQAGEYVIPIKAFRNGAFLSEYQLKTKIGSPVTVKLNPLNAPLNKAVSISAVVKNIFDIPVEGSLELTMPNGQPLKSGQSSFKLKGKQSKKIIFPVKYQTAAEYNHFPITSVVRDPYGKILLKETLKLDFTIARIASSPPVIDGKLDDWKNAFPVHLLETDVYVDPKDLQGKAYAMIDSKHFYLAVEVHDEMHHQEFTGGGLWKNDSIQVSFDPKKEKTEGHYGPNDIELGWALAGQSYKKLDTVYVAPNPKAYENVRYEIIRNNDTQKTIYEIAIPLKSLPHMPHQAGKSFGFNVALHDSDRSFSRESLLQFTTGTSAKNPHAYKNWTILK
ncbi:MAG: sugar-binding protein [Verrucomicrobiota bacterium]